MNNLFFANLPVKNLKDTIAFFSALGFTYDERFSYEDHAAAMVINNNTTVMLLPIPDFLTFINKEIADTGAYAEVILSLMVDTREEVDAFVEKAFSLGAKPTKPPLEMPGMYTRTFQDPDGHLWEIGYMDLSAMGLFGN